MSTRATPRSRHAGTTALIVLAFTMAVTAHGAGGTEPIGPRLPERVRGLLQQEMGALLGASQQIVAALVRGQDDVVAEQAQAIHDSFILEQQMTEEDRAALKAVAPSDFVQRDRAFHELSGRLARAARDGDDARQRALFGQMIDACAGCHRRYAADRFPGLDGD